MMFLKIQKYSICVVLSLLATTAIRAQMVAVNTDIAGDALLVPNLGVEMVVGEQSTIGLHAFFTRNPYWAKAKMVGVQPEWRYYPSRRHMHSLFFGIGALGTIYDIQWKGKVYDGHAAGAGVTFGYVWKLGNRFNLDLHAGLRLVFYKQKEYFDGDDYDEYMVGGEIRANASGYYLMPTRIGLSIAYILK